MDRAQSVPLMHASAVTPDPPARRAAPLPPIHALFTRRIRGDDALLELARLRFAQAGMAAELYADTPGQLEQVLRFVPPHPSLPTVHMNRGLNLLREADLGVVEDFAGRFAGRLAGMVIHDTAEMGVQTESLVAAMRKLNARLLQRPGAPKVFIEYAAGLEPAKFAEIAGALQDLEWISCCIDVGHVGIRQASAKFARLHPGLSLRSLTPADARLPGLVTCVQDAVRSALPDVIELTRSIGGLGKHVHFHLHDGHPLVGGLSDHFSFLTRLPIPFDHEGRRSLSMLYGPTGLAAIVSEATRACGIGGVSFTLEIHQVEGRLPLADTGAEGLFRGWMDLTNAERMNHWLAVMAENAALVEASLPAAA
ncbi:MAG: hypothetical protein ACM3ML_35615 [Micromonosporaceae bacterium]